MRPSCDPWPWASTAEASQSQVTHSSQQRLLEVLPSVPAEACNRPLPKVVAVVGLGHCPIEATQIQAYAPARRASGPTAEVSVEPVSTTTTSQGREHSVPSTPLTWPKTCGSPFRTGRITLRRRDVSTPG